MKIGTVNPSLEIPRRVFTHTVRIDWKRLWWVFVFLVFMGLARADVGRIVGGALSLVAMQEDVNPEISLTLLNFAHSVNPTDAKIRNLRGDIWTYLADRKRAVWEYKAASVELLHHNPAQNNLAVLAFWGDERSIALNYAKEAVKKAPNSAVAYQNLGLIRTATGDHLGAAHAYIEASRIRPEWTEPYLHLGANYLVLQQWDKAELAAKNALASDRESYHAFAILLNALLQKADYSAVYTTANDALKTLPNEPLFIYYKARALHEIGEFDMALKLLFALNTSSLDFGLRNQIITEIVIIRSKLP